MEIEKAYFPLADVLDWWGIAESDLIYLAENDLLRLSIRVFDLPVEFGDFEETEDGGVFRIPFSRRRYNGVLDLCAADAFEVFRCAEHFVARFRSEGADYVTLLDGAEPVLVMIGDLLVRREERDRAERQHGLGAAAGVFVASMDYQEIRHRGRHYRLGPIQAAVVRALHAAVLAGDPWCEGKVILAEAGSRSLRMADVFKSQAGWRSLIRSNRRGSYRLDL